jgi:hypothetical protein
MSEYALPPHNIALGEGEIQGEEAIRKFGRNSAVGTTEADVTNLGADEVHMTTPQTLYASCTDTNAVGVFFFTGLGPGWKQQNGLVTLTGQTAAALTLVDGSPATWLELFRGYQVSSAAANIPANNADVWVAEADTVTAGVPQTPAKRHLKIEYGSASQQSEKAIFVVPSGRYAIITDYRAYMALSSGTARTCEVGLAIQELARNADVGAPAWAPRRRIDELAISTNSPGAQHVFDVPFKFGELTRISLRATASATSSIQGSFSMQLHDEEADDPQQLRAYDTAPL